MLQGRERPDVVGTCSFTAFVRETLRFQRIEANYLPSNERSGRLLHRLGFEPVGYARDYLFIDGAWRDHVLTALLHPDATPPPDS